MKLKYIDGPHGYARDVKALEIFENAVNNSEWLDENNSLVSGDMVGFNFGDDEVRATVEIGKEFIEVHLISPIKYETAGHSTCLFSAGTTGLTMTPKSKP